MTRTQTLVQLTDDLVSQLDDEARRRGMSRSALIRDVLTDHLAGGRERALVDRLLTGYRRHPPQTPDVWGNAGDVAVVTEAELLRRLDEEESTAGTDPW